MERPGSRADARTVMRLVATSIGAVLLLAGCSTVEGKRAQALLLEAEQAQAALQSATFEGSVGFVADGQAVRLTFEGGASKEGESFSMRATGLPDGSSYNLRFVTKGGRAWLDDGDGWEATTLSKDAADLSGSIGVEAFQELARHVKDVRVLEGQVIAGVPTTTIAGEIDTAGLLKAALDLGSLSEATGGKLTFDLDDLGLKLGEIEAVLSIDERTHLLSSAQIGLALEAEGEKLELDLRYRLTGADEPVELPAP